ncbi:Crossover junction endonuclease MUS81 [Plasmodiophora brassicae]|uniref:Crossover junction endonuclease MUS81 n=1 Tax=Plasmodiophora brassicae TaxID=37360 RepID=A0A3P3YP84_PLABS|nr:unnamed protein product [Plasmodiophora brassicae]
MAARGGRRGGRAAAASSSSACCACPFNEFIAEGLAARADALAAKADANPNIVMMYRKAITSVRKSPIPLRTVDDVKKLKFVGVHICNEIEQIFAGEGVGLGRSRAAAMERAQNRSAAVPPDDAGRRNTTTTSPSADAEVVDDPGPRKRRRQPTTREYIPRFMSGAFAILVAMAKDDRAYGRAELQELAQPYAEDSFTAVEVHSGTGFYNAWSSMATLIKKELVVKTGNPARYELTETGRVLGGRLADTWDAREQSNACASLVAGPPMRDVPAPDNDVLPCRRARSDYEVVLVIDPAERLRDARARLTAEMNSQSLRFERCKLAVGDYCWVARRQGQVGCHSAAILSPIVERKRDGDFASSIKDNRYEEQKYRLKKSGLQVVYLIEGDMNCDRTLDPKSMPSAIARMIAHDGFFVYHTHDLDNTIRFLCSVHRRLQHKVDENGLPANPEALDDFNQRLSKSIIESKEHQFGILLTALHGVTESKCLAILKRYPSLGALLAAYDTCGSELDERNMLAALEYRSKGACTRRIGTAVSTRIREFFRNAAYTSTKEKSSQDNDDDVE